MLPGRLWKYKQIKSLTSAQNVQKYLGTSTSCWPCSAGPLRPVGPPGRLAATPAMLKPVPRRSRPNPGRVIIADTTAAGELALPSSFAAGSGMTLSRPRNTENEESTTPPTPEMTLVAPVASSPTCCPTRPRKRAGADNAAGEDGTFVADSGSGDRSWVLHGVYDQSEDDVRPTECIPHHTVSIS